jgi:hypothetical protein
MKGKDTRSQVESICFVYAPFFGITVILIFYPTKKVSHPIWPVLPLNLCAFCQYSNAIEYEYEYRVYSLQVSD